MSPARTHSSADGKPSEPDNAVTIGIVGNPNVGKSTLFNQLTGVGVETAHYPGTTRDVAIGTTLVDGTTVTVVDLPGTYGLSGSRSVDRTATEAIIGHPLDAIIVVIDATNLARNLYVLTEIIDLGIPLLIALNLVDEARTAGIDIDATGLAEATGLPVVETVATRGLGVHELMTEALRLASTRPVRPPRLQGELRRAVAASTMREGEPRHTSVARARHELVRDIASSVTVSHRPGRSRDIRSLATSPLSGTLLLLVVLAAVFLTLFVIGDRLASGFAWLWGTFASPAITSLVHALAGEGFVGTTLLWGLDAGIEASLAIGLPYILTFYVLLALLEDSGYLGSVTFLTDRVMHRFGLHGRAIVPIVAGAGCSVPAVLATRGLDSERERFIASTLLAFVPCSARTAVILGAVGHYVGWLPALSVYGVVLLVVVVVGVALNRLMPGRARGLVMEMFPFRRPSVRGVFRKAWAQFREFLLIATPIVVVGSLVLGGLYESGWLWHLTEPLAPVVEGWLMLPAVAGLTLVLGLLRKELSLQLLVTLATAGAGSLLAFMSRTDIFVFVLVNTLAVPCVSTIAVLARVHGWRRTLAIVTLTVAVALLAGGIAARVLPALGFG